jgi:hypothetical protein
MQTDTFTVSSCYAITIRLLGDRDFRLLLLSDRKPLKSVKQMARIPAEDLIPVQTSASFHFAAMKCIVAALSVACVTANGDYLPEATGSRKCAKLWDRCNGIVPPIGPCEVGAFCTNGMYVTTVLNTIAYGSNRASREANCS